MAWKCLTAYARARANRVSFLNSRYLFSPGQDAFGEYFKNSPIIIETREKENKNKIRLTKTIIWEGRLRAAEERMRKDDGKRVWRISDT